MPCSGGSTHASTVDIVRHANEKLTFRHAGGAGGARREQIAQRCGRPVEAVRDAYAKLRRTNTLEELLAAAGIEYRAPEDADKLGLAARSVDIVYSNSVFEHVRPEYMAPILREAYRVLKDDGLMVHAIACNDHYAYFDPSVSFVHFLRYTDKQWRLSRIKPAELSEPAARQRLHQAGRRSWFSDRARGACRASGFPGRSPGHDRGPIPALSV